MFRWTLHNIDTGAIEVLKKDPKGYEDLTLTHKRSPRWHGIHYEFSTELGFFCKGAGKEMLDSAYQARGQEAIVKIKLEVKCNGIWTTHLTGKLDFSTYRQEWRDNVLYTYLNAQNENIVQLIVNREDLKVDLLSNESLDGVALNTYPYLGYDVNMHSKIIRIESEWETLYHGCCFRFISTGFRAGYIIPTTKVITGNFEKTGETQPRCVNPVVFDQFLDDAEFIVNTNGNVVFNTPQTVRVTWNIQGAVTINTYDVTPVPSDCADTCGTGNLNDTILYDAVNMKLRLYFGNPEGGTVQEAADCGANPISQEGVKFIDLVTIPQFATDLNPTIKSFSGTNTRDIILNPGDKIWYYWNFTLNLNSSTDMVIEFDYTQSLLNIVSDTDYTSTTCKSIAIHEAWSRLSEIIIDQNLAFRSEFFGRTNSNITYPQDGCGSRVAITSGKNIRRLANNPPILQSLKTMFDSADAIWGIGIGIERYQNRDVIRAEELTYFYSDAQVLKLDFVPNIQMKHREDLVYNEISLGFKKWETNQVNGLDEPLTRIKYAIPPVKSNKQKFERISEFVAGMYAIELTRRAGDVDTKDTSYDEDTFIIALRTDDMTYAEKDENMQLVNGLLSPETAYNLRLLLSATFDRLKNQFVAGITKLGNVLMPAEGEGNQTVNYQYQPNGCAGDHFGTQQLNGGDGKYPDSTARRDSPIWIPEEYTFDYPLSFTDYLKLVAKPYGLIRFSNSDKNHFSGWLLSVEYNIRNKSGTFTILRKFT